MIKIPIFEHSDRRGKYYQYGVDGEKYYVADYGEHGAMKKAEAAVKSKRTIDFQEKNKEMQHNPTHRVESGYDPYKGRYYRWGFFGTKYYVNELGVNRARSLARSEGAAERRRSYG